MSEVAPDRIKLLATCTVARAFERLDHKVPYIMAAGNHDFGYKNIETRQSNYDRYFPAHRNLSNVKLLREAGKKVNQMVFNAQAMGGGWHGNGGDGWLRILEFLPDG